MNRVCPENASVYASKLTQRSRGNWTGPAAQETCLKHLSCLLDQISDWPVQVHTQNLQPCTFFNRIWNSDLGRDSQCHTETSSNPTKKVFTLSMDV